MSCGTMRMANQTKLGSDHLERIVEHSNAILFRYHILDHCDFSELLMLLSIFMLILLLT